jgi:hypothetical protein
MNHKKKQFHYQQTEALERLMKYFFSSEFDDIKDLDPDMAKMSATVFFNKTLKPRLDELKETGQKMEDDLTLRKMVMLSQITVTGEDFESFYQRVKPELKEKLKEDRKDA